MQLFLAFNMRIGYQFLDMSGYVDSARSCSSIDPSSSLQIFSKRINMWPTYAKDWPLLSYA